MTQTFRRQMVAFLVACFIAAIGLACDKASGTSPSSGPTVAGCNSVTYQGFTFSNLGCAQGIASFTANISQNGHTACFNITCSSGCVSSARVC